VAGVAQEDGEWPDAGIDMGESNVEKKEMCRSPLPTCRAPWGAGVI
jgi:hypothetical protein